jgi:hypothetical protein
VQRKSAWWQNVFRECLDRSIDAYWTNDPPPSPVEDLSCFRCRLSVSMYIQAMYKEYGG